MTYPVDEELSAYTNSPWRRFENMASHNHTWGSISTKNPNAKVDPPVEIRWEAFFNDCLCSLNKVIFYQPVEKQVVERTK